MSFGLTYRSKWKNAEKQDMELNIWDRLNTLGGPRPYNIQWIGDLPGNGYNVEFTFDELPPDSTGLVIVATIPNTNISYSFLGSTASPRQISLPYSSGVGWQYKFIIQNPGQGETIDLSILYPQIVPVKVVRNGCKVSSVDSDDELFKVVKAKQLEMQLVTSAQFGLATFRVANAFDDRFYVTLQKNGRFLFKGYLILDEINEPFLSGRNVFNLRATDRLGTLKTQNLTNSVGENPRGVFRIIDYISWALKRTGLSLPINVVMNIREEGSAPVVFDTEFLEPARMITYLAPIFKAGRKIRISNAGVNNITSTITLVDGPISLGVHAGKYNVYFDSDEVEFTAASSSAVRFDDAEPNFYHRVYVDSKTFESDINESEDGYKVLEKLLGPGMFITQEKGEWWIKRHSETALNPIYVTLFDADGNYIVDHEPTAYSKGIGRTFSIQHINRGTRIFLNRPNKHIELKYGYNFPKELVCNIDYKRGDVYEGEEPDFSLPETTGKYEVDCWTQRAGNPDNITRAYIHRKFAYAVETERWIGFEAAPGPSSQYLESEKMPVRAKDRINFSVDYKYSQEVQSGSGFYRNSVAQVRLYGADGTNYMLHGGTSIDPKPRWQITNADFSINNVYFVYEGDASDDNDTEWRTSALWEGDASPDIPVDGFIAVVLASEISTDEAEKHFSNINLEYIPYLNGTYRKLNSVLYRVSQPVSPDGTYMDTQEEDIFIGNAWTQNFKGALLVKNGNLIEMAGRFYDASLNQDTVGFQADFKPYLELIAFDVYNQFKYPTLTWRASLMGLESVADVFDRDDSPGLLHRYRMLDPSPNSGGSKWNHLISCNQDHDSCQWSGVFREVWDFNEARTVDPQLLTIEYKEA